MPASAVPASRRWQFFYAVSKKREIKLDALYSEHCTGTDSPTSRMIQKTGPTPAWGPGTALQGGPFLKRRPQSGVGAALQRPQHLQPAGTHCTTETSLRSPTAPAPTPNPRVSPSKGFPPWRRRTGAVRDASPISPRARSTTIPLPSPSLPSPPNLSCSLGLAITNLGPPSSPVAQMGWPPPTVQTAAVDRPAGVPPVGLLPSIATDGRRGEYGGRGHVSLLSQAVHRDAGPHAGGHAELDQEFLAQHLNS